jgi:hypothetical protein
LEGNQFTVNVRGLRAIDGFFASDFHRFGTPVTGSTARELIISPFSAKIAKIDPNRAKPANSSVQFDIISPDLLDRKNWPFRSKEVLRLALGAPVSSVNPDQPITDDELHEKYEKVFQGGVEAVNRWNEKRTWTTLEEN